MKMYGAAPSLMAVLAFNVVGCVHDDRVESNGVDANGSDSGAETGSVEREASDGHVDQGSVDIAVSDACQGTGCSDDAMWDAAVADSSACRGRGDCPYCECPPSTCPLNSPEVATSCTSVPIFSWPPPDECACEGGVCPVGETCLRVFRFPPSSAGGPGGHFNVCDEPCGVDADCGAGRVCRRNEYGLMVCAAPSCTSDTDCTADQCGQCVPGVVPIHAGMLLDATRSECVYEGPCRSDSCAGCLPNARSTQDPPHRCMP
jgi:hypothetical protein